MNYELSRLYFGTNKLESILEFKSEFAITNFCYADQIGYILLFKEEHCLGLIDSKNKFIFPWAGQLGKSGHYDSTAPLFEYPSSACYSSLDKKVYVIENGGSRIRRLELNPFYASSVFGQAVNKKMEEYFPSNLSRGGIKTSCCIDSYGNIYWTVREFNRVFKYQPNLSNFSIYMGDGKYGFSVSSDFVSSKTASPSCVLCSGDSVYIADSDNRCIREGKKIIAGCANKAGYKDDIGIKALLDYPSKMVLVRNNLIFLDGDRIRYYSIGNKNVGTLYCISNIISIESDNKNLVVLYGKN